MVWPQSVAHLAIKADQDSAFHGWDENMIKAYATAAMLLVLAPSAALAQRAGDAALGAVAGAVVLGPVGAVAGAFRRLYGRAFDFAVVGTGRLAVVASPPAGFRGQRAQRQGGSCGPRTQFRRSGRPRHQLSGAEPAAFRQQAAARPGSRLNAFDPRSAAGRQRAGTKGGMMRRSGLAVAMTVSASPTIVVVPSTSWHPWPRS